MLSKNNAKHNHNHQELALQYEYLRQEVGSIDEQIKRLQDHHVELLQTKEGINELKKAGKAELMIPTGAGVYFNGQLTNNKTCLVNVGADVLIEMGLKKADKVISDRVDQVLSLIVQLNDEAEQLVKQLRQIESMISHV